MKENPDSMPVVHVGLPIAAAGMIEVGNTVHIDRERFVVTKVGGAAFDMIAEDIWGDDSPIPTAKIAEALYQYICPAGEPWTGDDATQDHGHTQCFWIGLAIQRLRATP